jgi:hypothetical protein
MNKGEGEVDTRCHLGVSDTMDVISILGYLFCKLRYYCTDLAVVPVVNALSQGLQGTALDIYHFVIHLAWDVDTYVWGVGSVSRPTTDLALRVSASGFSFISYYRMSHHNDHDHVLCL